VGRCDSEGDYGYGKKEDSPLTLDAWKDICIFLPQKRGKICAVRKKAMWREPGTSQDASEDPASIQAQEEKGFSPI